MCAFIIATDAATAMALSDSGVQRVDKRRRESMAAHCQAMKEARSCRRDVRRFTRSSTMVTNPPHPDDLKRGGNNLVVAYMKYKDTVFTTNPRMC